MTYAHTHVTDWRSGQLFDRTGSNVVVSFDNRHRAYNVDPKEAYDFEVWVYEVFGNDNTDPDEIRIMWD